MFEDFEMGVSDEATPALESEGQVETTEQVDGTVDNTQAIDQGNIPDATPEVRTVPVDVVEAMRKENQEIKAERDRMFNLLIEGKQLPQAKQPEPEPDPFAGIDPETFLTVGQAMELWEKKQAQVNAKAEQEAFQVRYNKVAEAQTSFRLTNPDYDDVIELLPVEVQATLIKKYQDPQELVSVAYRMAKALKGESVPSTPNTVKAKVDVENKINQNLSKPTTIGQAKGTGSIDSPLDPNDYYKNRFAR